MLRLVILILLLANAGYYAWSHSLLRAWGWAPEEQSEPERLAQQIRPETLQILRPKSGTPGGGASSTETSSNPDTAECLQAGVFDERQADAVRAAAAGLPANSWSLEATTIPGRWMIYMGRFADLDALDKKRTELRARKVAFDRPNNPTLEPGLSLGRFASEEAAQREMTNLASQGVRTARVVQERPDAPGFTLRLPAVNDALRPQLDALRSAMAGKTLRNCG